MGTVNIGQSMMMMMMMMMMIYKWANFTNEIRGGGQLPGEPAENEEI